jgi:phage terminase large subunit
MQSKKQKEVRFKPASRKFEGLYQFGGKYRYKIFSGGRASAKSWGIAEALIYVTRTFRTRVLCCREIQKSIKESAYQLIKDTAERYGVDDEYSFTRERITHLRTGSYFIFEGLYHNTNKIKSMEGMDIAWVEEAESVSEQSWAMLFPTIRKANSEIWISFNPRYTTDPTWQLTSNPRPKSYIQHMTFEDNPHLSDAIRAEIEHDQSKDPALYRWIWLGIPTSGGDMRLISDDIVSGAMARIVSRETDTPRIAGFDVARSLTGDSSALCIRQGNEIIHMEEWRIDDVTELVKQVERVFHTIGFDYLVVDSVGVGGGAFDMLKKSLGGICEMRTFNGSLPARKDKLYANLRAECWMMLRDALRDNLSIPNDKNLRTELVTQTYKFDQKNRYLMESKEVAKSKGIPSPNKSDAICMTFAPLQIKEKPKLNRPQRNKAVGYYG